MRTRLFSTILLVALPLAAFATEYQAVERPRQECWDEQVPVQSVGSGFGGSIIGGIAGGILGNQVGGGSGKTIATAVGAITGAVVGDRMSSAAPAYQTVQRCRAVVDQERDPVYFEPTPVYNEPAPVYYEPVPVVEQRRYYIDRPEPSHREQWRREDRSLGRGEYDARNQGRDDD
ncbi:MAG: glycine zipper 2TM domain-containing protein [Oxalobacteraceae bacterium]